MKQDVDQVYRTRGLACPQVKLWVASPLEGLFVACLLARAGQRSITVGRQVAALARALTGPGAGEAWAAARCTLAHLLAEAPAGFARLGTVLEHQDALPDAGEIAGLLGQGDREATGSWWWAFEGVSITCDRHDSSWSFSLSGAVRVPAANAR